jgi:hypothetical protein
MGQVVSLGRRVVQHILSYFIKKFPIYGTLCLSFSIHHITLERERKGSSSGGLHRSLIRGYPSIEGQLGYNTKYDEKKIISTF